MSPSPLRDTINDAISAITERALANSATLVGVGPVTFHCCCCCSGLCRTDASCSPLFCLVSCCANISASSLTCSFREDPGLQQIFSAPARHFGVGTSLDFFSPFFTANVFGCSGAARHALRLFALRTFWSIVKTDPPCSSPPHHAPSWHIM